MKFKINLLKALRLSIVYSLLILGTGVTGFNTVLNKSTIWIGIYILLFCLFYGYYFFKFKNKYIKCGFGIFTALFATSVGVHSFGSPSWEIASLQLSPISPFTFIYFNFDKLVIAICILFLWDGSKNLKWRDFQVFPVFIISFMLISMVGIITKYIAFDPKIVPINFFVLWAFKNLLLVSLPEELFFRGFIQHELGKWNSYGGWIIASLLFGIGHIGGGFLYVFLSTLAGLMYGWLYLRTNNIFISILAHFFFNTLHIGLFTYPYLISN